MIRKATFCLMFQSLMIAASASTVQSFWDQSFASGMPSGWTTGDESGQNVAWEYCGDPAGCPPATFAFLTCRDKSFRSATFEDGYMYVNSFKNGVLPVPHVSYLRSAPLDCSQKSKVFIRFATYLYSQNTDPETGAVLRVKNAAGQWQTFTIFPFLKEGTAQELRSWNPQEVLIDISSAAANQANVQIEWRWTGNFEASWQIDDVALFDDNPLMDNVVWGNLPGQGDFDGGLNGWTVPPPTFDVCKWEWSAQPLVDFPDPDTLANAIGCSHTYNNGVMIMNATFCSTTPFPSPFSKSELRSPSINLAGIPAGTRLALRFSQSVAIGNTAENWLPVTSVLVSIDGGLTFIDTIEANPTLPFSRGFCGTITLDLPIETAGNSDVRVHFVFSGDTFYWMLDDVTIIQRHEHDLRVSSQYHAVAPEFSVPATQVRPIVFFADIENIGQDALHGVTAFATVTNGLTKEVVFRDTVHLGTLMPGEVADYTAFPKTFTPPSITAKYVCTYHATADETDQDTANNTARWHFEVTDSTFSKAGNFCDVNGYFTPNQQIVYEAGTCYFIPKGSKIAATSVSFAYKNAAQLASAPGSAILQATLYRWKTDSTWADVNLDTIANVNEYERVAFNQHVVKVADNNKLVNVAIDFENAFVPLEDSTYYFVTVGYLHPVSMGGNPGPFFIGCSEEIDYTTTFLRSFDSGIPAYTSMLRTGNDDYFRANAWALRRIPLVQLHVQQLTSNTEEIQPAALKVDLYPNPAAETVYLHADLSGPHRQVSVEIFDICGRLVQNRQFENTFVSQLPIDIGGLSNGSYILRVFTDSQLGTAKLLVMK